MDIRYVKNEDLPVLLDGYAGNEIVNGRFTNDYDAAKDKSFLDVLRWRLFYKNPQKRELKEDNFAPNVIASTPPFKVVDKIVWLGHASFIIDLDGMRMVIDPIFGDLPLMRRRTVPPYDAEAIGADLVLVSHGHYDHMDIDALRRLNGMGTTYLMPLGLSQYVKKELFNTVEMGWYQLYKKADAEIIFLPAYHWHSRYGYDKNRALWGSFLIRYRGKSLYFAGDSGYNDHFKKIRRLFGDIEICILPTGAYKPDFIMKKSHMNPQESIQAFKDLGGKKFIPMHYGTFQLSDEPPSEGIGLLNSFWRDGELGGELCELSIGQVMGL